jgi:thiol-disulfide isomerase/thioredoxin
MLSLVNRYSYLIASAFAMAVAWAVGARLGGFWAAVGVAGVGASLALVQRKLRGGSSAVKSWDEADAALGRGTPVLVFIYSDTCGPCLTAQRIVDRLERELDGHAEILRLNIAEEVGQRAHQRFGTTMVPAIILLDGRGTELYRTEGKLPRRQEILAALDSRSGG